MLGASSIGQALLYYAQKQWAVIAGVSRFAVPEGLIPALWLTLELQQGDAGATIAASLPGLRQQFQPTDIVICHGLLPQGNVKAEKTIRQLDELAAIKSWWVNYLLLALHLQALFAYLQTYSCCMLVRYCLFKVCVMQ